MTDSNWEELKINPLYEICSIYPHDIRNKVTKHILKPYIDSSGYYVYTLSVNKKQRAFTKHRCIASQWIPNEQNLPSIDHIDNDKLNNIVENLRWVSISDNNKNMPSKNGYSYTWLHELPTNAKPLNFYYLYTFANVYVDYENKKIYQYVSPRYRELRLCVQKDGKRPHYNILDINNKCIRVNYNRLFGYD